MLLELVEPIQALAFYEEWVDLWGQSGILRKKMASCDATFPPLNSHHVLWINGIFHKIQPWAISFLRAKRRFRPQRLQTISILTQVRKT